MRNIDYWKKRKENNEKKIILILSWIFYRTFNEDSRFLSDKFWFKIKRTWWYEVVWFPKNALKKYLNELKQDNFWYTIFEKDNKGILSITQEYKWWKKLIYNNTKLVYLEKKEVIDTENKNNFQEFLKDLEKLILKYK